MKKVFSIVIVFILLFSMSLPVFSESEKMVISESIEYLDDGGYIVTTLSVDEECYTTRATVAKTGSKKVVIYNDDDEALVTMKLTATFNYTGTSATCTNVSPTFTVHNSYWRVTKSTGTKSGNKGIGEFTAKHYVLGIPVQTRDVTITITCSNTGVLS